MPRPIRRSPHACFNRHSWILRDNRRTNIKCVNEATSANQAIRWVGLVFYSNNDMLSFLEQFLELHLLLLLNLFHNDVVQFLEKQRACISNQTCLFSLRKVFKCHRFRWQHRRLQCLLYHGEVLINLLPWKSILSLNFFWLIKEHYRLKYLVLEGLLCFRCTHATLIFELSTIIYWIQFVFNFGICLHYWLIGRGAELGRLWLNNILYIHSLLFFWLLLNLRFLFF